MPKKILIVEDNLDMIDILQVLLKNLGYEFILATNGKQAVDIAAAQLPDLIMLDIVLPEMNGLDAARLIRRKSETRYIPILAVTSMNAYKDKQECLQSGCDDYISKPFTHEQLSSRIKKLLPQMKKKILIVDDHRDLIYILQKQVESLGYDFILATNGKQAVDMTTTELPDFIILDIMMPEMDGLEATRLIRENPDTHSIPILASTPLSTLEVKEDCLKNGCNDYIAKPFTTEELGSRIGELLKQQST